MGVNHKKIRQLIAEKKKSVNDRQFFASRALAGHFADMAAAQTKRYGYNRKVKVKTVWEPKNGSLAYTDNEMIWINAGNKLVTKRRGRPERYEIVCGLFTHELGHVLYTNFLTSQSYDLFFQAGKWFPEPPPLNNRDERMNEADIWDFCKSDEMNQNAFLRLAFELNNILEDGYIESKMLYRFPGKLGGCLESFRNAHFEDMETLTQWIDSEEDGTHIWQTIMQLILSYVKWGEIKYGDEPLGDERVQTVFALLADLDRAVTDPSSKERWNVVNIIMVRCWHYIKEFLELCVEQSKQNQATGNGGSVNEIISRITSSLAGSSQEASGETESVESGTSAGKASAGAKRSLTAKQAAASVSSEDESEDEENVPSEDESGEEAENGVGDSTPADEETDEESPMEASRENVPQGPQEPFQEISSGENGRLPHEQTTSLYAPTGGETTRDDDYEGSGYPNAAKDVERILEDMAEQSVCTELEKRRTSELNELAKGISYGNIHEGVAMTVHRMADVKEDLVDAYNEISSELRGISKKLQKSVLQKLLDKRTGGKMTNLTLGRRLDVHALPRGDGHVFYKSVLPNDTPELAVGLLLDESGSMSSRDRATYARATAIILHDFCQSLHIPAMIYGHSTDYNGVDLYSYVEFDKIDRNDCYRLMDISSRGSNRDGAALRYVAECLSRRPEEVKILILVSDGQPADTGYYGAAAEDDLRGIMREYQRKDILFIAASIGDDSDNLKRIYGDAYMDITDLNKLPVLLANVIKQHMRV